MNRFLADTSAWHRSGRAQVRERWDELLLRGALALCSPVRLELLYSARGRADYDRLQEDLTSLPELPFASSTARRADEIQARLATQGHHRGPTPVDLYIAAVAELNGVTLLHYDRHLDAIARVTGQPAEWIAARGTLD